MNKIIGRNKAMIITRARELILNEKANIERDRLWGLYHTPEIFESL